MSAMDKSKQKSKGGSKKGKKSAKKKPRFTLVILFGITLFSLYFLSSAVILFIGLLPMFVAFFVDRSKKKTKAITVGAMNIAGCAPFLMELWTTDSTMDKAFSIIFDPVTIVVIYMSAGVGYLIDWAVTIIVSNFLYQRGIARKDAIEKRQKELIERWGEEVGGRMVLDEDGFPLEKSEPEKI